MLVVEGMPPESILLMTFTRASTRELSSRVRDRLNKELEDLKDGQSELIRAYSDLSEEKGRQRMLNAIAHIDTIEIQTIHGFAAQLVQDYGPETGIPSFPVETDTDAIQTEVTIDLYRKLGESLPLDLLRQVTGGLAGILSQTKLAFNPIGKITPEVSACPDLSMINIEFEAIKKNILPSREALLNLSGIGTNAIDKHCDAIEKSANRWDIPKGTRDYFLNKKRAEKLSGTEFDNWVEFFTPSPTEVAFKSFILRELKEQYKARMQTLGITDYDQIIRDAAKVAGHMRDKGPRHHVILLDEFQDTDRTQWSMLDALYPDTNERLMVMVGDPKQSIYRFRGADTEFYQHVKKSLPQTSCWTLNIVFRSAITVVDALNTLFIDTETVGRSIEYRPLTSSQQVDIVPLTLGTEELSGFVWTESMEAKDVVKLIQYLLHKSKQGLCHIRGVPLSERHINVLVDKRTTASEIKKIGEREGLACHYPDNENIFKKAVVSEVIPLLKAIANPEDVKQLASAATTGILGFDLTKPNMLTEQKEFALFQSAAFRARDLWVIEGPSAALEHLFEIRQTESRFAHTLQGREDWECLIQCLEIFGEEAKGLNPLAASRWWIDQATNSKKVSESKIQRTPADTGIIVINTIHGSKGLEYPIVILAGDIKAKKPNNSLWGHDYCSFDGPRIDLTAGAQALAIQSEANDLQRLVYVALTRAKHTVFCGLPNEKSVICELIGDRSLGDLAPHHQAMKIPDIKFDLRPFQQSLRNPTELNSAQIPRWFFRSFSSLIKNHSSPELESKASDEYSISTNVEMNQSWHSIPGGIETGNFIHTLLEWHARSETPNEELVQAVKRFWPNFLNPELRAFIHEWITAIVHINLGDDLTLESLPRSMKRPEPQFELPLKNGIYCEDLFKGCEQFSWWNSLIPPIGQALSGHLIGFIDLVFESNGRYSIIDYKTNYLGPTNQAYSADGINAAMDKSFYTVQAAIYGLALHRWLQSRMPNYDPETHLGDVIYLFCRGIDAPSQGIWRGKLETTGILALEASCLCTH